MESSKETKLKNYVDKLKTNKDYNKKYLDKSKIKLKVKNSREFSNIKEIKDDGIIVLKNGEYALVIEVNAIDLTLFGKKEREIFLFDFKELFKIKDLKLKCYKLDRKMNLNPNKEHYEELINRFEDDEKRNVLLTQYYNLINQLEEEKYTLASSYYFVLVAKDINTLNKQLEEIEIITNSLNPKMYVELISNKLQIYDFLCNLYSIDINLDQLMWLDLPELISPLYMQEKTNLLKIDDKEVQIIAVKKLHPFNDGMFLDEIFNMPNVRACININDGVDTDEIVHRLDRNYGSLLSDRSTSKKLSDVTEMDAEKENYQILMNDIKNGNEKIKEISMLLVIDGTRKEREELYKTLKKVADRYQIKLDIPRLRQMEAWQSFDITGFSFKDYVEEAPTLSIAGSFPFTQTYFNDYNGYLLGHDIHTDLPIFFNPFYLNKKSRTSHNIAIVSTTGGGKSFTIKKILVNEFARGTKIFILDPESEYEKLVRQNGGEYIDLYSKKNGIINPLQIRYTPNEEEGSKSTDYPLPKHLGFLESFFKVAFDDIREKELVMLLAIIEALYNSKGIYSNTTIEDLEKLRTTDYPIFSDLKRFIPEYKKKENSPEKIKIINQLEILISRFLTGTDAYLFDGYTTIDLSNDLIAFNMKELLYSGNERLINTQTINLLTYLSNAIVSNKINNDRLEVGNKKPICIVADEFHLFIDEKNCEILRNFGQLARRIRKYTGSLIVATQSIEDFVGNADIIRHAKAIFNNCQYQLVGMLKEADLLAYLELFKENPLTDVQKDFLLKANQGQFLININHKKRLKIQIDAIPLEKEMMGETK